MIKLWTLLFILNKIDFIIWSQLILNKCDIGAFINVNMQIESTGPPFNESHV